MDTSITSASIDAAIDGRDADNAREWEVAIGIRPGSLCGDVESPDYLELDLSLRYGGRVVSHRQEVIPIKDHFRHCSNDDR